MAYKRKARRTRSSRTNRRIANSSSRQITSSRRARNNRAGSINEVTARTANRRALWQTYKQLQNEADRAWNRFRSDVQNEANIDVILRDHTHLLLLLGECDYMARECMQFANPPQRRIRA